MSELEHPQNTQMDTLFPGEIEDEEDANCQSACATDAVIYSCWILVAVLVVWLHLPWLLFLPGVGGLLFIISVTAFCLSDPERFKPSYLSFLKIYGKLRKGIAYLSLLAGCVSFFYGLVFYYLNTDFMKSKTSDRVTKELVYLGMTLGFMCCFQGLMMVGFSKSYDEGILASAMRNQLQSTSEQRLAA